MLLFLKRKDFIFVKYSVNFPNHTLYTFERLLKSFFFSAFLTLWDYFIRKQIILVQLYGFEDTIILIIWYDFFNHLIWLF